MANDMLTRQADFRANSYDPEKRTFKAVIATDSPVLRHDAQGPYSEVLPADAFDLSAQSLPVLDSHNTATVRAVLGRTLSIRREGNQVVADLQLSSAEDVAPIGQRIADGTLSGVSIGYRVAGWATRRESGQRIKTATGIALREVTLTSNPADPNATVRQEKESAMPKDVQDEEYEMREALYALFRRTMVLPADFEERTADLSLTDTMNLAEKECERQESGAPVLPQKRSVRTSPVIRTIAVPNDDPAMIRNRQTEALACRMMGTAPSEAARPFMGYGLADHAREALAASGVAVRSLSGEEVLTRAMHTTSDFPELLTGAGNRVLANAYQQAQSPLKTIARQRTAADFRAMSILKLGEFSGLQKVSEHGEIKAVTTGEAKEGYSLETFGGIFSLSRKALVNDDLGAFGRWGEMMGRAAAETEAAQLLALLTANSGGGVKLSDGVNLFHASHGNLAGSGAAPSETTLSAARLAMRTQKGLDGSTPVNVVPRYILCGPALETTLEKVLATINPTATADVNPFGGKLTLLVEPRITGNGWYVFADPASGPVLEYAYLASAPGPQLSSRDGWEVLGREFRVVLDFGCGATDSRGAYRNAGA